MFSRFVQRFLGPRVPAGEPPRRRWRYAIPTVMFILAAAVLSASYTQPYWNMTMYAPQYPKGLRVDAYLNRLEGDVRELDGLNHYIGMRPLNEAAQLERKTSHILIGSMALLLLAAVFIHTKWAALLAIPALLFPAGFLLDLFYWLHNFGQNLDPTAALSSSVKPFTPPLWGEGKVGNFRTVADVDVGWYMALGSSALVLLGLFFHRRAYKPLVDVMEAERDVRAPAQGHEGKRHARVAAVIVAAFLPSAFASNVLASTQDQTNIHTFLSSMDDGAVVRVPAGEYAGPLVIDRSVKLIADGRVVIDGRGEGDVVRILAPDVKLRGFIIRNSGKSLNREHTGIHVFAPRAVIEDNIVENTLFGITLKESPNSIVRGNTVSGMDLHIARRGDGIRLWASHDTIVENNTVREVRDVVMWYSDRVQLIGNHISRSRYGLHFMYSHDNVLERNLLEENSVGAFLMYSRNLVVKHNIMARNRGPSGYGLGLKDMQGVVVENNLMVANRVAVYIDNPPIFLPEDDRYTRNVFAYNEIGVVFQPSVRRTAFFENSFLENQQQVAIWGGGELRDNRFTVETPDGKRGNFWSDYRGFDLDGDGIGDLPHHAESLWDSLLDREPKLRLFLFSPVQQATELASKAFPVVRPRPLLTDDAPLMRAVVADVDSPVVRTAGPTWLLAIGLLAFAVLALTLARPQMSSRHSLSTSPRKQGGVS